MPSNTILTIDMITREALRVLHQKCNFISNIDRQHDDSFANSGAKIGQSLRIRLPNQYTVRSGAALSAQDSVDQSVTLPLSTQKGVDISFSSAELTMSLDDFSKRIIDPAISVLAAAVEADALSMVNAVYNSVDAGTNALTFKNLLEGRKMLNDNLAPQDSNRTALLNTQDSVDLVDALKGLFHESTAIEKQYSEGMMGRTAGFDFYENTLLTKHTQGTHNTAYVTNGVTAQTGSTLAVDTGTGTILKGDVFTIGGVFRVHPESKVSTGVLQQFTVTADSAGGSVNLSITPPIWDSTFGGRQNVSNGAADGQAITFLAGASKVTTESLVFHKEAFTFATADLILPKGVDMAAREVMDGISMRMVRNYDINNDAFPCRVDVLYGYVAQRAALAARLSANEV